MPATDHQAVLEVSEVQTVMAEARRAGSLVFALTAWMYEFGARGAEPGLQLLRDVDMRGLRARPVHLKQGRPPAWHRLLPFCRAALPPWLEERTTWDLRPEQEGLLFPSRISTGRCYTCAGTGKRPILRREGKQRFRDGTEPCHHCAETGARWGMARQEVYTIVRDVLLRSGLPRGRAHPHVLRHSIITHMLDAGVEATVVRDRVGHRRLETTMEYARTTQAAIDTMEGKLSRVYRTEEEEKDE